MPKRFAMMLAVVLSHATLLSDATSAHAARRESCVEDNLNATPSDYDIVGHNQNNIIWVKAGEFCMTTRYLRITHDARGGSFSRGEWDWLRIHFKVDAGRWRRCTMVDVDFEEIDGRTCLLTGASMRHGIRKIAYYYTGDYDDDGKGTITGRARSVEIAI